MSYSPLAPAGRMESTLTHDKVPLSGLAISNLLVQCIVREVRFGKHARVFESLSDLNGIVFEVGKDGNDDDLTGGEPEGPEGVSVLGRMGRSGADRSEDTHHFPP